MKKHFKTIFWTVFIVGAFLLGKECGTSAPQVITKSDTTYVHDTVYSDPKIVHQTKRVHDTMYIIETYEMPLDSLKLRAFFQKRVYKNSYKGDSIKVHVTDTVIGYLIGQGVQYNDSRALSITNSTIVSNTVSPSVKAPKWEFKGGLSATPRNLYFQAELELNRNTYGVGYDPFNKTPMITYKRTLFRSRK